jgi:NAD(P)-dependent dehydrogenase (short-subunit alcohol dehydrogenase family)
VDGVVREMQGVGGGAPIHAHVADLALMSSVRELAAELRDRHEHIDVLANNAGALFASRKVTSDGFERCTAPRSSATSCNATRELEPQMRKLEVEPKLPACPTRDGESLR